MGYIFTVVTMGLPRDVEAMGLLRAVERMGDTSPSYLLFQTLLPLFWTLTCMIWMELTRTDAIFSRIAMMLFYVQKTKVLGITWNSTWYLTINNKKSSPKMKTRGPTPFSRGWGVRPGGQACLPASWPPRSFLDVYSKSPGSCLFQK